MSNNEKSKPILLDSSTYNQVEVNSIKLNNDTTVICLKNAGVNLLDVRIDSADKRELSIQKGKLIIDKIIIPTQETIQGFAVNWIKETEYGFEISIEYGSRNYHHKDFRFYFENKKFVLKNILVKSFDKYSPENKGSYTTKTVTLKKAIEFRDFKIENFL